MRHRNETLSKVPTITLGFWIFKILATTLGETGGDTLSMTWELGYLVSTLIFIVPLVLLVVAQIRAQDFHPLLYWATITLSQTLGTALGDWAAGDWRAVSVHAGQPRRPVLGGVHPYAPTGRNRRRFSRQAACTRRVESQSATGFPGTDRCDCRVDSGPATACCDIHFMTVARSSPG